MIEKIADYLKKKELVSLLKLQADFTVTFLAQGEYNQNFLISDGFKKYVFRLNYGSQLQLDDQITYEFKALKWLEKSQRTPKVYYVDDQRQDFPQGLLIMAFLDGQPLDYRKDLLVAADIFGDIHQLAIDSLAENQFVTEKENILAARISECQFLLEPVFKSSVISNDVKKMLAAALESNKKNVHQQEFFIQQNLWSVNNTEVNSHNFIIGEKGYLIDWEKPVISHPVQDISQFLASTTTLWRSNLRLTLSEKQEFLARYLFRTNFDQATFFEALRIYHPYLMLRALSWSAMAYDNYLTGDKALKNQEIFEKVSQYLEPEFLSKALREDVLKDE